MTAPAARRTAGVRQDEGEAERVKCGTLRPSSRRRCKAFEFGEKRVQPIATIISETIDHLLLYAKPKRQRLGDDPLTFPGDADDARPPVTTFFKPSEAGSYQQPEIAAERAAIKAGRFGKRSNVRLGQPADGSHQRKLSDGQPHRREGGVVELGHRSGGAADAHADTRCFYHHLRVYTRIRVGVHVLSRDARRAPHFRANEPSSRRRCVALAAPPSSSCWYRETAATGSAVPLHPRDFG